MLSTEKLEPIPVPKVIKEEALVVNDEEQDMQESINLVVLFARENKKKLAAS